MASTLATTSSDRLTRKFSQLRSAGRKALVCFTTAGYPDYSRSLDLLRGLEASGADVVEVGVPFSDPIADGPAIQESSQRALEAGMTFERVLQLVAEASLGIPVVIFTYLNPLISRGPGAIVECREAGADGILVTDLPVGADPVREKWIGGGGLAFVRLVAPTTPFDRMKQIGQHGSGFVYLISRLGVTGRPADISASLESTASRLREATDLPVCIGFGISEPAQVQSAARIADGVVVGSAIVRACGTSVASALSLTRSLRAALDG